MAIYLIYFVWTYLGCLLGVLLLCFLGILLGLVGVLVGSCQGITGLPDQIFRILDFLLDVGHRLQGFGCTLRGALHIRLEAIEGVVGVIGLLEGVVSLLHRLGGLVMRSVGPLQQLNVLLLLLVGSK